MINGTESGTQALESSSDTFEWRHGETQNINLL